MLRVVTALVVFLTGTTIFAQEPADLEAALSCPPSATAGADVACFLAITNHGPAAALSVSVLVLVTTNGAPNNTAETLFVAFHPDTPAAMSCSPLGDGARFDTRCAVATLAAGATASGALILSTDPIMQTGFSISLTAQTSMQNSDLQRGNNFASSSFIVDRAEADLAMSVAAVPTVLGGANLDVAITLSSSGPSISSGVSLTYDLPPSSTFVAVRPSQSPLSCTTPPVGQPGTVRCTGSMTAPRPAIGVSQRSLTFTVTLRSPQAGGVLTHVAEVTASTFDPNPGNNRSTATTTATPAPLDSADLSITKSADKLNVEINGTITYTLTVRNAGPATARSVIVTDDLPSGMSRLSAPDSCNGNSPIECRVGDLASGSATTVTIVAKANSTTGQVSNSARVSSETTDNIPANNLSTAVVGVVTSLEADLGVTIKSFFADSARGAPGIADVRINNQGPAIATNVVATLSLPPGTSFSSVSLPLSQCTTPARGSSGAISCTIEAIKAGSFAGFRMFFNILPDYPMDSVATVLVSVQSDSADLHPADNAASLNLVVRGLADLSMSVAANATTVRPLGDVIWTMVVTNHGPDVARQLEASFVIFEGAPVYVSATSSQGLCGIGRTVQCQLSDLTSQSNAVVTIVTNGPFFPGQLTGRAAAVSADVDPSIGDSIASAFVTVAPDTAADMSVAAVSARSTDADRRITITVRNAGPSAAALLLMSATLPADTTFQSLVQGSGPAFACQVPTPGQAGAIRCSLNSLNAGAEAEFLLTVRATSASPSPVSFSVQTATEDPNMQNNSTVAALTDRVRRRAARH